MTTNLEYQVMARSMRPKRFDEVIGQERIKTTLKNAFLLNRLGHAYLFCGPHGTGKTTLARLFAKILNCDSPEDGEPCLKCSSCKEITQIHSMEVIEIDGASNRGIDDIRQINETVSFATSSGKYKIYIIDEVHMLTKEAFNALLKTLEEPPKNVKFFFATTEPHKVPSTILSRCQCFQLEPISIHEIKTHLIYCLKFQDIELKEDCAELIAQRASGSLRDALVLCDQILSYCNKEITFEKVSHFLGLITLEPLFTFDKKAHLGSLEAAFNLAKMIFDSGKNIPYFLEMLAEHYRTILYIKTFKQNKTPLSIPEASISSYQEISQLYSFDQCLAIIDMIIESQGQLKFALSKQVLIENLLIRIVRSYQRISPQKLLDRLESLKPQQGTTSMSKEPPVKASKKDLPTTSKEGAKKTECDYNTLLQFAAVELEGSLKKEVDHG